MKKIKNILIGILIYLSFFSYLAAQEGQTNGSWFFYDRAMPNDSIPPGAFKNAVDQQWAMRLSQGYGISQEITRWVSIGPSNNQYTGRTVSIKYHPTNPNIVYVLGHCGGVWKTTNAQDPPANVRFEPMTDGLQTQSSGDIAIDPTDPTGNTLYYGTGGSVFCFNFNYYGIGVYKSTNAGSSWTGPYTNGLPGLIFTVRIVVNPANGDVYLANGAGTGPYGQGSGGGLYKSVNGGVTWSRVLLPNQPHNEGVYDVVISSSGQYVYTVSGTGYWRSSDYGASFEWMNPGSTGLFQNGRTQIAVSSADVNHVYIVTDYSDHNNYAFASFDGGLTFAQSLPIPLGYDNGCMSRDFMYVQASPINPSVAFIGYGGEYNVWRTTDAGHNYVSPLYNSGADKNNFAFNPLNVNQAMECNDQGLFRSNNILGDNIVWAPLNYTLSFRENSRVASNQYDPNDMVMAAEDAGFFKYNPNVGGETYWEERNYGCDGTNVIHSSRIAPSTYLAGKGYDAGCPPYFHGVWISTTGGNFWGIHRDLPWSYWDANQDWIAAFAEKPNTPGTFYHPRRNETPLGHAYIDINFSSDYGQSWTRDPFVTNINPINTQGDGSYSPQWISVSAANPNLMYVSTKRWLDSPPTLSLSKIFRTIDGGGNWQDLQITNYGVPNRVVSSVVADPCNESIVYLTLSGFGTGHVYKSNDKGTSWSNIENLPNNRIPDLPCNYMVIRYVASGQKELIVATDAGVYHAFDPPYGINYEWQELAYALPNTPCLGLDYNLFSVKLRAALFGRGIWELRMPGPIYIPCNQVLGSPPEGINIADDIIVGSGATLTIPEGCIIKMPADKKIIVQDGGRIDASIGNAITFTSQSGNWGGIEFQGSGYGTLTNCTFQNTLTPVVINGTGQVNPPAISVSNCSIYNAPIQITNRPNVTVYNCTWTYNSGAGVSVCGVAASGSDNLNISTNTINYSTSMTASTGISVNYGNSVSVIKNTVNNTTIGILLTNTSPFVSKNYVTSISPSQSNTGMSLDNSYSSTFTQNRIIGYQVGYKLNSSSPVMYQNASINGNSVGSTINGMDAQNNSNPRLTPTISGGLTIWDAGKDTLRSNAAGNGIYLSNSSVPVIDNGYNLIFGAGWHLKGSVSRSFTYYARCNGWVNPPLPGNFDVTNATVVYTPYDCVPPGGGGENSSKFNEDEPINLTNSTNSMNLDPPPSLIVNYGNGVFDTLHVSNQSIQLPVYESMYYDAVKQELLGNFTDALSKHVLLIQTYPASRAALNSMRKLMYCNDRRSADTVAYSLLRAYYQNLIQTHQTDTPFVKVARELAAKTLVRKHLYVNAITEYENIVITTNDTLERLCAELNIIETYMLIPHGGGNAPSFTGQLQYLKPSSLLDGYRMIMEKLHKISSSVQTEIIPREFNLAQNYPNPFNPITKIEYSLPKNTNVKIKIFDLLGKLVKVLVNEYKKAGKYNVEFDGTNLASGTYFYSIEAGSFLYTKRMVLVK